MESTHKDQSTMLRMYNNNVKSILIEQVSNNGTKLFDLGVGRGGDIHKWNRYGITKVIGVDINISYIQEAQKRFKQSKYKRDYKFYVIKHVDHILKNCEKGFDNVSCNFAFHYFCSDLETLHNVFKIISELLKVGGYFIGTVPDGEKIVKLLGKSNIYKSSCGVIKKDYLKLNKIGDRIKFGLSGTLYFGDRTVSIEYLVFKETLEEVAKQYGLLLVFWKGFEEYEHRLKETMNEDTKTMCYVNSAFMFKKIT